MTSSDKAQELLRKYSLEALGESLLAYVTKARAALGPPLLKVTCGSLEHCHTVCLLSQNQSPFMLLCRKPDEACETDMVLMRRC